MKEIVLQNKKNGMVVLLATLAAYVAAIVGAVFGIANDFIFLAVLC